MVITDDELQTVEAPLLQAAQEVAPVDLRFTQFGADAQHDALAFGVHAQGDENGTGSNRAVDADFFVTGIHDEVFELAQGAVAPFGQFQVHFGGGLTDLGGGYFQAAKLFEHGGDFAGGDALDIHFGDGQLEGAFASETLFQSAGIEVHVAANLGTEKRMSPIRVETVLPLKPLA